jgi:hypothetical protein
LFTFIVFEITAQAYLIRALYSFRNRLKKHIYTRVLKMKLVLVSFLVVVAVISIPIISMPGDKFKFLKHALEWNYFLGVIAFYLLTFFMWKNKSD